MSLRLIVPVLLLTSSLGLGAQDRSYGRSVVSTPFGIVATSEVEASQAGARIFHDRSPSKHSLGILCKSTVPPGNIGVFRDRSVRRVTLAYALPSFPLKRRATPSADSRRQVQMLRR